MGFEYIDKNSINRQSHDEYSSWKELEQSSKNCHLCKLSQTRENVIFGTGNKEADIMFVGLSPSLIEDEMGEQLIGNSGELLIKIVENVLNISYKDIYITNILKCRLSQDIDDVSNEVSSCMDYLKSQISLVNPKIIVTLGEQAYQYLTNSKNSLDEAREKLEIKYNDIALIPTHNLSTLIRNPSLKKETFEDILKVKDKISSMQRSI